ncbi:MAG: hypothetical protein PUC73_03985 [Lachnospiraceae bacterium]|nr:hypothetical protein [Lachnospiraceae bacterium]
MKKKVSLSFVLLMSICLMACGKGNDLRIYEYSGMNDDNLYFDYSGETYRYESMVRTNESVAEETREFRFMGEVYELTYAETDAKEFLPYAEDYYYAGDIEFAFVENTEEIAGICCYAGDAIDIRKNEEVKLEKEKDYKQIADSVVKEYINIGKYTSECSTRVTLFEEKDGVADCSYKNYDYFYAGNGDESEIRYTFTYIREFKGYETCETVFVTLNEAGQLCNLQLNAVGMFDNKKEAVAKRTDIDKKVKQKLKEICREEYLVGDVKCDTILCVNQEGDFFYVSLVDSMVESTESGVETETKCVFLLADE